MLSPNIVSYTASETIPAGARVKFVSGSAMRIELADAADLEIGTAILHSGKETYLVDTSVGVKLMNDAGSRTCIALTAIAAGATVYRAADGKVDDGGAGDAFGIALAATDAGGSFAAGEFIEVLSLPAMSSTRRAVVVDIDGATLTASQSGAVVSNAGAIGAATFVLPVATVGLEFYFLVEAAQELRIDPNGSETIALPSSGVQGAAGKYLTADAIGERVHLLCVVAGTWDVLDYNGTWTAEA